jgi:hypothetical protein
MKNTIGNIVGWIKAAVPLFSRELHALACLYWSLWFPMVGLLGVSVTSPLGKISGIVGIVLTYLGLGHAMVNAAVSSCPAPQVESSKKKEAGYGDA